MLEVLPQHSNAMAFVMGRAIGKHQPFPQSLREKVRRAGLEHRVMLLSEASVDAMPRWYQTLDLLVAPQRREGFGVSPLMA